MRAGELDVRGIESLLAMIDEYLRSAREQSAEWLRRRDEFEEIRILAVKKVIDKVIDSFRKPK